MPAPFLARPGARNVDATVMKFWEANRLVPLSRAVDNHGSQVWECTWESDTLRRYLTFAVTDASTSAGDRDINFIVEIFGGADDGIHFTRCQFTEWKYRTPLAIVNDAESGHLWEKLESAKEAVDCLRSQDLTEDDAIPRGDRINAG